MVTGTHPQLCPGTWQFVAPKLRVVGGGFFQSYRPKLDQPRCMAGAPCAGFIKIARSHTRLTNA